MTLTIRGRVEAGEYQIVQLGADAKVIGIAKARPEWWGASGNGTDDDQPEVQAAEDSIEQSAGSDGERAELLLRQGAVYGLGRSLTITPTANVNLRIDGGGQVFGTRFRALASFDAAEGPSAVRVQGSPLQIGGVSNVARIAGFDIGNFSVDLAAGSSAQVGLMIGGDANTYLYGVANNRIHHVYVENFLIAFQVQDLRLVRFEALSNKPPARTANAIGLLGT